MDAQWVEMLMPTLHAVRERFRETVGLAVLDETAAAGVIVAAAQETGRFGFALCAGHRFPIHTGAPAKAIAAFLPPERLEPLLRKMRFTRFTPTTLASRRAFRAELARVRASGYALDRAEEVEGCHCLAVPLFGADGLPLAGIWFTGPSSRLPIETLTAAFPALRALVDAAQVRLHAAMRERQAGSGAAADKIEQARRALAGGPFDAKVDLVGLARGLGMSYSAFRHAFRARLGTSPAQFRLACRLEEARRGLERSSRSLAEIATTTGFPSPAHFSTLFKKKTGLSPRDYRAGCRPR